MEDNKSSFIFHDKSSNAVLSVTPNLWNNIQIVRTLILKHNISNSMSFTTKYSDFETLHCCFGHVSNKVMCYVLNNVKDVKNLFPNIKICLPWLHP